MCVLSAASFVSKRPECYPHPSQGECPVAVAPVSSAMVIPSLEASLAWSCNTVVRRGPWTLARPLRLPELPVLAPCVPCRSGSVVSRHLNLRNVGVPVSCRAAQSRPQDHGQPGRPARREPGNLLGVPSPGEHTNPVPITVPRPRPPPRCLGGISAYAALAFWLRYRYT